LHRLLEAENASTQGCDPTDTDGFASTVETGFDRLFSSSESISPKAVEPYSDFSSKVWAGFEALGGACWVVMAFEPANKTETNCRDINSKAPKLTFHPVVTGGQLPKWITVEGNVEKGSLEGSPTLTLKLLSHFIFSEPRQSGHVNGIAAILRSIFENGKYEDIPLGYFPITTVPMLHTQSIHIDSRAEELIRQSSSLRLILFLPAEGGYVFDLFGLSLKVS